jgi:hypothetical protein
VFILLADFNLKEPLTEKSKYEIRSQNELKMHMFSFCIFGCNKKGSTGTVLLSLHYVTVTT